MVDITHCASGRREAFRSAASFNPLSATSALVLHSQQTPSGAGGDAVGDDFQVTIPPVTSGSYGVALYYVAMTN